MPLTEADRLRRMLGDRIPPGKTEADCFFSDEEIADLLDQNGGDNNAAAFQGWVEKMAEFARLIDQLRGGNVMRLKQLFTNAQAMADHYGKLAGADVEAVVGRIVGRRVNLRDNNCTTGTVMTGVGAARLETLNDQARRIMNNSHPDLADDDPSYPEPGPVATS